MAKCVCPPRLRFNTRVTIQKPKTTPDSGGHVDLTKDSNWQSIDTHWAAMKTRGGRESRVFDQVQAETTHIVEMRYGPITKTIIPKWRLKIGTRKLNITAAHDVDERHETIRIEATEAV